MRGQLVDSLLTLGHDRIYHAVLTFAAPIRHSDLDICALYARVLKRTL